MHFTLKTLYTCTLYKYIVIKRPTQRMCVYVCVFEALTSVLEEEM